MNKSATILLATLGLILSQPALAQQGASGVQTLRGADAAAEDRVFAERTWEGGSPGSQKALPRTYSTQPPLIPHSIEDFGGATLADNPCMGCHGLEAYRQVGAPRIGASHFVGGDPKSGQVAAARHVCLSCHVPQADARPLVGNDFKGDRIVRPAAAKKR